MSLSCISGRWPKPLVAELVFPVAEMAAIRPVFATKKPKYWFIKKAPGFPGAFRVPKN